MSATTPIDDEKQTIIGESTPVDCFDIDTVETLNLALKDRDIEENGGDAAAATSKSIQCNRW